MSNEYATGWKCVNRENEIKYDVPFTIYENACYAELSSRIQSQSSFL